MRFVDRVRILVKAGDGGDGHVGWRREKFVPRGGPAGGDGGRGGDVVLVADGDLSTLLDLRYRQHYRAENGKPGRNKGMYGPGGDGLRIRVPAGTAVYLEGLGEPGERPPWVDASPQSDDDDGGMEMIYVFDDEFEDDVEEVLADGEDDEPPVSANDPGSSGDASSDEVLGDASTADEVEADDVEDEPADTSGDETSFEDDENPEASSEEEADDGTVAAEPSRAERRRREREDARLLGDLVEEGQELLVAQGGRGGRGNIHFRSSTNRTPTHAEPGTPGEGFWLRLELKLLADVGIVGFPNVGKSTLISRISRARPKVGAYPFTTLVPQLGVVSLPGERSMVVADVPGLIKGASEGRGLGLDFLRHLERTRVLLHLLAPDPGEGRSPLADLDALEGELRAYGSMFDGRPRVVALNKIDTQEGQELVVKLRRRLRARRIPVFPISAATGEGISALLEAIWRRVALRRELAAKATEAAS